MNFVRRRRNRSAAPANDRQPQPPQHPNGKELVPRPPEQPKPESLRKSAGEDLEALLSDPHELCCPVTLDLFKEPVNASDGFTYERQAIETIIQRQGCSPNTREPLSGQLVPNHEKKAEVQAYRVKRAGICLDMAILQKTTGNYIVANQLMERAVALNGGNATIYARWISLLEAMSWHGKALVLKFFLAEAYQEQDQKDTAMKVYDELLEQYQMPQPMKLPWVLFNGGLEKFDMETPGNVACVMARPILLHVIVADKLLPLIKARGDASGYKKLLLRVSETTIRFPDTVTYSGARVEALLTNAIGYLGPDDHLWNLLAQLQLLMGKAPQAGSSYVNAARCCGMAGDNEAAEWYLTKSAEVGSVEGMMALIDFLRDKEDTYKQIIARQHKELVAVRNMALEERSSDSSSDAKARRRTSSIHSMVSKGSNGRQSALHSVEDGELLARLCLETEEDQNRWRLAELYAQVQADPSMHNDSCAFRSSWIDRTQTSSDRIFINLKANMETAETQARERIMGGEEAGWEELMFSEEAAWTKVNVCIIEKAYRAYCSRKQVASLLRKRKLLHGRADVRGGSARPSTGASSSRSGP